MGRNTNHDFRIFFEWQDLQFIVDSERHIFLRNFFMAGLFTQKSAESSYFVLMSDLACESGLMSYNPF